MSKKLVDDLKVRFTYHKPDVDDQRFYEEFRREAKRLALLILDSTNESREQSLAITKLEEVVMWANAARARRG